MRLALLLTLLLPPIALAAEIRTLAGIGQKGFSGDNAPAHQAQLNNPYGLSRGPDGALYVCDMDNHLIRRIAKDGTISTVAGNNTPGHSGDGGPATKAQLNEPYEVRFDRDGHMFFVEMRSAVIRRVDKDTGLISTIAGAPNKPGFSGDNGPATKAQFNQPHSIQFSPSGDLYVCDIANHRIRRIDMKTGLISTFAGTGDKGPAPDGAPLANTPLNGPRAIDFDKSGDMWLALREGNAVYKIDMKKLTIHHAAGTGKKGFTGNGGPAKLATLSGPKGVSVSPLDGNIYLADTESHSIRYLDLKTGNLELLAGTGEKDDGPEPDPLKCRLNRPHGIFVDPDGAILIGDSENHRIRILRR